MIHHRRFRIFRGMEAEGGRSGTGGVGRKNGILIGISHPVIPSERIDPCHPERAKRVEGSALGQPPDIMSDLTRREFLERTAIAGAADTLGDLSPQIARAAEQAQLGAADPAWVGRPMRWAQLTLAENDPGSFDLNFWLDYFRR